MPGDDNQKRSSNGAPAGDADRAMRTYHILRELIVRGRIAPGTRIVERELARRLGVSRTPVHGAVQRLQQEGYVVALSDGPRNRPQVAPVTREDGRDVFEIVAELEGLAARRAAALDSKPRRMLVDQPGYDACRHAREQHQGARAEPVDHHQREGPLREAR